MAYVGIDTNGTRELGQVLRDTATRTDAVRQDVAAALNLADLASEVPAQLGVVQDSFTALGAGVADKAELAERFTADPQATLASLGAPVAELGAAITGLLGFAGPSDLRAVLFGLPAPGTDPELDAALARLTPALLPALLAGQRPDLKTVQPDDLRQLALRLGIENAGPPTAPGTDTGPESRRSWRRRAEAQTGTEVFWKDFWADGRTVEQVLADPQQVLDWVAGTIELDRRFALASELPELADVLASVDFAANRGGNLDTITTEAQTEFAAITGWLPAFLVGQDSTGPDATQLTQTLAFATRVGWPDPGAELATDQQRFSAAIGFLRANRALQSALLPTGFEGDPDSLAFLNEPGIALTLDLGRRTGVIDDTFLGGLAGLVDQALAGLGLDLSGPDPVELTDELTPQLFALLATQLPRSLVQSPTVQGRFVAALGYLRQATSGPDQRQRLINVIAAFRTLAVTGAPALTERQLGTVVGQKVLDVLGRGRLRRRSTKAVGKNPEFLLVARQWGIPGSNKQKLGKYKFTWSFNDLGELTGIRRKKRNWFARTWDTVKAIGKSIWESWKDNPLKGIFQVGKLALGALAFAVPGLQGLGVAAFATNLAEAAYHAVEGDWLSAIGAGLSAFTGGASDIVGAALPSIATEQAKILTDVLGADTLSFLKDTKRVFDIGNSVFRATQADSLVGTIGAGLSAAAVTLGNSGALLKNDDPGLAQDLGRLSNTVKDVTKLVTPTAGLVDALDKGNVLAAFGNGLSVISAGAGTPANPQGAFADPATEVRTEFGGDTLSFTAGPLSASGAAPDELPGSGDRDVPVPPGGTDNAAVVDQPQLFLAQAGGSQRPGPTVTLPNGTTFQTQPGQHYVVPRGSTITAPDGVPLIPYNSRGRLAPHDGSTIDIVDPQDVPMSSLDGLTIGSNVFDPTTTVIDEFRTELLNGTSPDPLASDDSSVDDLEIPPGLRLVTNDPEASDEAVLIEGSRIPYPPDSASPGTSLWDDILGAPELLFWRPEIQLNAPIDWAKIAEPVFVPNRVLDGDSRTVEDIYEIVGLNFSAEGSDRASEGVSVGVKNGILFYDDKRRPVDGLTVDGTLSWSALAGPYGAVASAGLNLGPLLDFKLPELGSDYMAGVNIPWLGAIGIRATSDASGTTTRWLEQRDFPTFEDGLIAFGPGAMVGVKYPVSGYRADEIIAHLAGIPVEEMLLSRQAPAGTSLAFDVNQELLPATTPGFGSLTNGTTLDLGTPESPAAEGGGYSLDYSADNWLPDYTDIAVRSAAVAGFDQTGDAWSFDDVETYSYDDSVVTTADWY